MQITTDKLSPTSIKLNISADADQLATIKKSVVARLGKSLKLQGFREGKAPASVVERNVDQAQLQNEFLEQAVNDMFVGAVQQDNLRPVNSPAISITKFVPFSTLEITAEVDVVGDVTLPDYTNIKIKRDIAEVTDEQVEDVVKNLQKRAATRKDVKRAAKNDDEVTIDFKGVDAKTKEAISGADGSDYPLLLGSGNFIPGFEDNVVGMNAGEEKTFDLTFPADYGVEALQSKKVTFTVTASKVQELVEPKLDKDFVASVGPFNSIEELRKDIRRELENQANQDAERKYENDLVEAVANKTVVEIPNALVQDELERLEQQERQNIIYRGQTWQEHLDEEGVTEEEHRKRNRPGAELRVKAGLVLSEIAEAEKLTVSPEELEVRLQLLRGQYANDENMLSELDKPENRRDIMSRLLTEKTLDKLKALNA